MTAERRKGADVAAALERTEHPTDSTTLARWLGKWWEDGFLRANR